MMPEHNNMENNLLSKRPPNISISLDYVSGFQSYDKRDTLFYINTPKTSVVYFVSRVGIVLDRENKS